MRCRRGGVRGGRGGVRCRRGGSEVWGMMCEGGRGWLKNEKAGVRTPVSQRSPITCPNLLSNSPKNDQNDFYRSHRVKGLQLGGTVRKRVLFLKISTHKFVKICTRICAILKVFNQKCSRHCAFRWITNGFFNKKKILKVTNYAHTVSFE